MLQAIKIRLKLENEQRSFFEQNAGACRWVYNQALARYKKEYENGAPCLSKTEAINLISIWKPKYPWLYKCESTSLQQSISDLSQAFQNFFNSRNGKRKGNLIGFPKFKAKKKVKASFRIVNTNKKPSLCIEADRLKVPKLGLVKFHAIKKVKARIQNCRIKYATFSRDSDNHWYASILIDGPAKSKLEPTEATIGIDLGIKNTITASTGAIMSIPEKLNYYERKIAKANRNLHRKILGSKNREKARLKLAKLYYKAKKLREDWNHQISYALVKYYDIITLETLKIQNMMKNRRLAKKVANAAWFQLKTFIKYKAEWYGKIVIEVSSWFPSSKLCHCCGTKNIALTLADREWTCSNCNTNHNRDINAAKNLDQVSQILKATGVIVTKEKEYLAAQFQK